MSGQAATTLVVKRRIAASPERLFEAWTTPAQLEAWWGPRGVRCVEAEVDPRVGGRFRIGNALPDGRVLFITGEFLVVDRPTELVYTWSIAPEGAEPGAGASELVTVRFERSGVETEVVVRHERVPSPALAEEHERGWEGCLEGLALYLEGLES